MRRIECKNILFVHVKSICRESVLLISMWSVSSSIEKNRDQWSISESFQRKPATLYLALDLIYTIDFITQEDKKYIIDENKPFLINRAFNSVRNSDTRIRSVILPRVKEWVELGKSHDAVCLALEQNGFVSSDAYKWIY